MNNESQSVNAKSHKPVVIFNSGAGAVGKTSVVTKCLELAPEYGHSVVAMPSITRSVYARLGIDTEKAATEMGLEEQLRLQNAIFDTYFESVSAFIADNQEKDVILIDRSPLDHVSYLLHNLSKSLTLEQSSSRIVRAQRFLFDQCRQTSLLVLMYYPFPDYWHTYETESSDGFRYDSGGKNLLWALTLEALVVRSYREISEMIAFYASHSPGHIGEFVSTAWPRPKMDVEARARYLLSLKPS